MQKEERRVCVALLFASVVIELRNHDHLGAAVPAHPVDRSREARSSGELIAAGCFGDNRYRLIGSANDVIVALERRSRADVDHESLMLGVALPDDRCTGLHAEGGIALRTGDAGSSRCRL